MLGSQAVAGPGDAHGTTHSGCKGESSQCVSEGEYAVIASLLGDYWTVPGWSRGLSRGQSAPEAINAYDLWRLCPGALLLRRAHFAMWEEKLCGR
jgi:hypothetical protein